MKKLLFGTLLLALVFVLPIPSMARVIENVGVSLPPIVFGGPPELVVIPETNVYAVPDVDADIFFYGGWWWRPWQGKWYRSHNYDSGWGYYRGTPSFHRNIPSDWNQQRVPHQQVQQNWRGCEKNKHWQKENNWGVKDSRNDRKGSRQQQQNDKHEQRGDHERGRN